MISVVIPALNEANRVASVIRLALQDPGVSEVLVIDDGSIDETAGIAAAAGARVITSTLLGKGTSMFDGLQASRGQFVVYLDGDLAGLRPDLIAILTAPLLGGAADFVKARFTRQAGRVTELTAKPLLSVFFPELAQFAQPLGGLIAARRDWLERCRFETDYGVDLGLLIDSVLAGARVVEVDAGHLEHESQTLDALGDMARQVVRVILDRAERHGRLGGEQFREVEEIERHMQAELGLALARLGSLQRLALFDMDGTLVRSRFILELARRTGKTAALAQWLDRDDVPATERARRIAALFAGTPKQKFIDTARELELTPGAVEAVVALRRAGYRVGVVSDSYHLATEILRRRVFADFSIANLMRFRGGVASGELTLAPAFFHAAGCPEHEICKRNVLEHLFERFHLSAAAVVAIGDNVNDVCLLRAAGTSIAFEPKTPEVAAAAQLVVTGSLVKIPGLLQGLANPATA